MNKYIGTNTIELNLIDTARPKINEMKTKEWAEVKNLVLLLLCNWAVPCFYWMHGDRNRDRSISKRVTNCEWWEAWGGWHELENKRSKEKRDIKGKQGSERKESNKECQARERMIGGRRSTGANCGTSIGTKARKQLPKGRKTRT